MLRSLPRTARRGQGWCLPAVIVDAHRTATTGVPPGRLTDWAPLLKRVHGIDALECIRCGGRLRFPAIYEDKAIAQADLRTQFLALFAERDPQRRGKRLGHTFSEWSEDDWEAHLALPLSPDSSTSRRR